ncbi:hypothetical protein [Streptosporangium sp. NPDC006930]|uniref:hypothetical protein n=1 Tax=unclassified Streptosporangium TaxID=2632669 RepID=UPI0034226333
MTRPGASFKRIRRRCDEILRDLPLPTPFDAVELCETVARRRGRAIRLAPMRNGFGVMGLWAAVGDVDMIFYEEATTPPHQEHIILHELGHLLCGHDKAQLPVAEYALPLMPGLDPRMVRTVLGRTSYSAAEEQEAELLASLILQRFSRATAPVRLGGVAAGRIDAAFGWTPEDSPR